MSPSNNSLILLSESEEDQATTFLFESIVDLIGKASESSSESFELSDDVKLKLYGYFKVATEQCSPSLDSKPSVFNVVKRAKYNSWQDTAMSCSSVSQAMKSYVDLASDCLRNVGYEKEINELKAASESTVISSEIETNHSRTEQNSPQPKLLVTPSKAINKAYAVNKGKTFLPQSTIARGTLDISYNDLIYALWKSILPLSLHVKHLPKHMKRKLKVKPTSQISLMTQYQSFIEEQWLDHYTPNSLKDEKMKSLSRSAVVGLSVRSLFDLYLNLKSYPPGSEIIITPPINIKGMIDIATKTYNLKFVPIDLSNENCIQVDFDQIQKAITNKTVAIMIVHPFGQMALSPDQMKHLSHEICYKHDLDLIEDCAECFPGRHDNLLPNAISNEYATVAFYSFGFIKTATALGGAIAYFPNHHQFSTRMKKIIQSRQLSQSQTNQEYLRKIIKALVLKFVSETPYLVGMVAFVCKLFGIHYGDFISSLIKAFPKDQTLNQNPASLRHQHADYMRKLRYTPSIGLYSLLSKRLHSYNHDRVKQRIKRCEEVIALMKKKNLIQSGQVSLPLNQDENMTPKNQNEIAHYFWLFPILVQNPDKVCSFMMKYGFDVPRGTSQLDCVENFLSKDNGNDPKCHHTSQMMKQILYLPIASKFNISSNDLNKMIEVLSWATSDNQIENGAERISSNESQKKKFPFRKGFFYRMLVTCTLFILMLSPSHLMRLVSIWSSMAYRISSLWFVFIVGVTIVRVKCSQGYLSSNQFMKFNSILIKSLKGFTEKSKNKEMTHIDDLTCEQTCNQSTKIVNVFDCLNVLTIPEILPTTTFESQPPMAFVTGSTGLIGSLLVRTLLIHRKSLNIPGGVVLLCRPKSNRSGKERIYRQFMNDPIFSFLSQSDFNKLVHVVEGEVTSPKLGMSGDSLSFLSTLNVTHAFHVAASVSFVQPIENAAESIITSSLQMQALARTGFLNPAKYIHFSTAFVHGECIDNIVTEDLYNLEQNGKYDVQELYKSMMGTQALAWDAMRYFKFPNTYTFAKSVCEHLLLQNDKDTIIIRPSIVGPSVSHPYEGWCGKKPSTLVAAACLYMKFQWSLWCFGKINVAVVPVDVVVNFTIQKAFKEDSTDEAANDVSTRSDSSDEETLVIHSGGKAKNGSINGHSNKTSESEQKRIYNVTWDYKSPPSHTFQWCDFASVLTHTGRLWGYLGSFTAYLTLFIAQNLKLSKENHTYFHNMLVRWPYKCVLWVLQNLGLKSLSKSLSQMGPFLDLPLLFYHFCNHNFRFESELLAPKEYSGERYMVNCVLAAEDFMFQYNKREKSRRNTPIQSNNRLSSRVTLAGRSHVPLASDFWWAFTQPDGNIFIRISGFILIKILRYTATELTVDLESFCSFLHSISDQKNKNNRPFIVLAPTHRSLFDFLVISFVCFSIPELGIAIPHIAAADDFERITFLGWFAKGAHAFFIRRGAGKEDPRLKDEIKRLKEKQNDRNTVFEVFLEGKRSRDRRFIDPKTGLLRCLKNTGGDHMILPLSISYERIPEQALMVKEKNGDPREKLGLPGLFRWLSNVLRGDVNIGRIHVQAATPVLMSQDENDIKSIAREIQYRQKKIISVSEYHIDAGAKLLQIPPKKIKFALRSLGCNFYCSQDTDTLNSTHPLTLPQSISELWSVLLQYGHWFSPFLLQTHPEWSEWLDENNICSKETRKTMDKNDTNNSNDCVAIVVKALIQRFEDSERAIKDSNDLLISKGFLSPSQRHLIQNTEDIYTEIPSILIHASASILFDVLPKGENSEKKPMKNKLSSTSLNNIMPLFSRRKMDAFEIKTSCHKDESFGAWGYIDSGFILQLDEKGARNVTMKGDRYSFSGRKMPKIVEFLEREMSLAIDPCKISIPFTSELDDGLITKCEISKAGLLKLVLIFENDKKRVSTSVIDRVRHGTGHTQEDMYKIRTKSLQDFRVPDAVVWPTKETEVKELIAVATSEDWCLIPFGGGTNVTHATWCPTKEQEPRPIVSVDMKLMNKILWVNEEDGTAHIQAGMTGSELIQELEKNGLTIGHEPDSIEFSTLGGWIATKASGMKQNKYGNIEDIVMSVRVAGAEGLLWQNQSDKICGYGRVSTGIDLKTMMLGSEGCLGIITSAIVKVWPLAEKKEYDSVILSDFESGVNFVRDISKLRSLKPASARLVDNEQLQMAQALSEKTSGLKKIKESALKIAGSMLHGFLPDSIVAVTLTYEGSFKEVKIQKSMISELVGKHGAKLAGPKVGKSGYDLTFAIAYLRDFAMSYALFAESFETFVPWSKLVNLVCKTKQRILDDYKQRSLPGRPMVSARVTQLYDNGACVYFYFCMSGEGIQDPNIVYSEIEHSAREEILRQGGSLSHHHGVGKLRASFMKEINSKHLQNLLLDMKKAVDPKNIFCAQNGSFSLYDID